MADDADTFLSRWSRRKAEVRAGTAALAEPVAVEFLPSAPTQARPAASLVETGTDPSDPASATTTEAPPPPTMADVARLTRDSDYTRYLGDNVNPEVKNAALKHLFTDPHFNVMDGLDTYIGDYNTPDPLSPGMLRQMVQSQMLGLFDDEVETQSETELGNAAQAAATTLPEPGPPLTADPIPLAADENSDLQLQPDDDAGRPGAETGAGAHAGRPD